MCASQANASFKLVPRLNDEEHTVVQCVFSLLEEKLFLALMQCLLRDKEITPSKIGYECLGMSEHLLVRLTK